MSAIEFRHDRKQIILPVAILPPDASQMRLVRTEGLLDTGASLCGLDAATIRALDLPRAGKITLSTPVGAHVARSYRCRIGFYVDTNAAMPHVMEQEFLAIESHPGDRFSTLVGMNVLGSGALYISSNGSGTFTFKTG